jgi:prophage antirepressor-like protein
MPDLIPFHFGSHTVRVEIDEHGNPWWIAMDVCEVLALKNVSNAVGRLALGEKGIRLTDKQLIINESGLYRLIFRSDKPEAKAFQAWVFEEVLPSIRKTGTYNAGSSALPKVKNPAHQMLIDAIVRLDAVEQQAQEAQAQAVRAQAQACEANATANRALEAQPFKTVAEYVFINKLERQLPETDYKACSDHLRLYCQDHNIPFRKIEVGGKRWSHEYGFHDSVYAEILSGWLKRRFAQQPLKMVPRTQDEGGA